MCHLANVRTPRKPAYFPQGAAREGKREENAGWDNNRGPLAPLPLLRGRRARAHRPQRGALPFLPRRPERPAPGDAHLDKPAPRRDRPPRLRVRPPRDAAPPRRGLPLPRVRLGGHPRLGVIVMKKLKESAAYR